MEDRLLALGLLLDKCGVPLDVDDLSKRKTMQKVVYMAQAAGINLGYPFGWYLMGPYSPKLTQDYYRLAEDAESDSNWKDRAFSGQVTQKIDSLRPIIEPPGDVELCRPEWLELVASLHFLISKSRKDDADALAVLQKEKPQLAPFAHQARSALAACSLL